MFTQFPQWVWSIPEAFNIGAACSDRHLGTLQADNIAMIVEDDTLGTSQITFAELSRKTDQFCASITQLKSESRRPCIDSLTQQFRLPHCLFRRDENGRYFSAYFNIAHRRRSGLFS